MRLRLALLAIALTFAISQLAMSQLARAAEIQVVSGGAFKQVLSALAAQYQKESGNTLAITYQTVGQHLVLIRGDKEKFDVAILTPEAIDNLAKEGRIVPGTRADLAKTGIGVVVKAGAPLPDIATVAAFKQTLLAAKSVAYIDPKSGGSSGIYVERLLQQLGIAKEVNAKAVLVNGGAVADRIADGEAEIGIHQISEILPVAGTTLVGPLPASIQNYTIYAAGVGTMAKDAATARALVKFLAGPDARPIIEAKGMELPAP
jgi:molybdate transport system substrate-binding protein